MTPLAPSGTARTACWDTEESAASLLLQVDHTRARTLATPHLSPALSVVSPMGRVGSKRVGVLRFLGTSSSYLFSQIRYISGLKKLTVKEAFRISYETGPAKLSSVAALMTEGICLG